MKEKGGPVKERSTKIQAIIDLVHAEIDKGKSSSEIDKTIGEYQLSREEKATVIQETFEHQVQKAASENSQQNRLVRIIIGSFFTAFGATLFFLSDRSEGIQYYLYLGVAIAGAYYLYVNVRKN